MITYLLQLTVCWAILFMVYYLFLRRETFFKYNRWFLLGGLMLGLLIPLIDWAALFVHEPDSMGYLYVAPIQYQAQQLDIYVSVSEKTSYWPYVFLGFYLTGVIVTGSKLIKGLAEIYSLRLGARIIRAENYQLVLTQSLHLPFSFMKSVYWSEELYRESDRRSQILAHELQHVSAWHSLDILFIEVLSIVFWFHPLVYIYRKELREVHEYEADAAACIGSNKKEYGKILLEQARSGLQFSLANHFIYSQLKNRLKMMTRNPSNRRALWKYLMVIPFLALAAMLFSFAQHQNSDLNQNPVAADTIPQPPAPPPPPPPPVPSSAAIGDKNEEIFRVVEEMPRFPGCEDMEGTSEERKRCADEKMLQFLYSNIRYPEIAVRDSVEGQVVVSFIVEKDGRLTGAEILREPGSGTGEEVLRLIEEMNIQKINWTPGRQRGMAQRVQFILPVKFALRESKKEQPEQKKDRDEMEVDVLPFFPGVEKTGLDKAEKTKSTQKEVLEFLYRGIRYPAKARNNGIQGEVSATFAILKDGTLDHIRILSDPGEGLGDEVRRILTELGKQGRWTPAYKDGKPVDFVMSLPVNFRLEDGRDSDYQKSTVQPALGNMLYSIAELNVVGYSTKEEVPDRQSPLQALIILDGEILGKGNEKEILDKIEPADIESISVLKGDRATDKYGPEAQEGVIEITSKIPALYLHSGELELDHLKLYPNPADHLLQIELRGPAGHYILEITDIKGATFLKKEIRDTGDIRASMELDGLHPGIYYLLVRKDRKIAAQAFVKQ